ncbi:LPS assembly lipoprotein LptE [Oricola cellulosilytica]|uniref:LPS-assembly lipoprotein n=1 Tax=Oricola cellulosilytica TaxID=1429082 RepID=A0A4R0PFV4_9HYPH|nr:LPS assembly lipoprotein LptE [Oricola cellulosilytica]TCD15978.1 hypothetical protein E0D97_00605 [Oricola cellulosilytica]
MKRRRLTITIAALAMLSSGCTVQPLYAPGTATVSAFAAPISSIYIEPAEDRIGQELRNELIFLLNGGSGQPSSAEFEVSLDVASTSRSAFVIQRSGEGRDGEPTSRTVDVTARYALRKSADNRLLSSRQTMASASYDISVQEFANTRAERDAENRAAREVAEQVRALLAADLARLR